MHAKHPKIAAKWDKKYGGGGSKLPEKVKKRESGSLKGLRGR